IEERFAGVLGLSEHQRHCAVHKNTGNLHLHIAYNLIHPERLTMREPFRDYHKRDRLCRELEREYGLAVDRGRESGPELPSLGGRAAQAEAHSGQESFESYAKRHTGEILAAMNAAQDWQAFHTALAHYGLELKPHGNGLVIKDQHGKHAVKASAVDRSLSMEKLEARFNLYIPPQEVDTIQEQSRYQAVPLHRAMERGERGKLFAEYRQGIEDRKTRLQAVKEREDAALAAIRKQWAAKRKEIEGMGIAKKNRRNLLALARRHEAEAIAKARLAVQPEREAVRRDVPFTDWNGFLRGKAGQGNETALAILRSGREAVGEEKEAAPIKDWSRHGREQFPAVRADYAARERAALELENVSGKAKKRLLAVLRMERLAAEESGFLSGFQHTVDGKGTVVFTLPGGGVIRDAGKELFFSARDEAARHVALAYARKKWGKGIRLEGNRLFREPERELEREKEQRRDMER
ncbi:MAG: relaxase/mobilization nuclease domain-containing protein, partial [Desulfovibrio sp.]|nr:relaxase/mobilization nuclease domain-containing protein [Desulfovibrio sp.]